VADIRELIGVYRDVIDESEPGVSKEERLTVEAGRISR
jgi:hypothetical protein